MMLSRTTYVWIQLHFGQTSLLGVFAFFYHMHCFNATPYISGCFIWCNRFLLLYSCKIHLIRYTVHIFQRVRDPALLRRYRISEWLLQTHLKREVQIIMLAMKPLSSYYIPTSHFDLSIFLNDTWIYLIGWRCLHRKSSK